MNATTTPITMGRYMTPPNDLNPDEPDLTVAELAKLLDVRPETVRRYLTSGAFPGAYRMTDGPKAVWRIPRSAVLAWRTRGQRTD